MAYAHIKNLYQFKEMLMFKQVYALEKIHGCSANLQLFGPPINDVVYFSGDNTETFSKLFDGQELAQRANAINLPSPCTIYGENYGGSILKQSHRYGDKKRFVAFDVKINDRWLNVDKARKVCEDLGIEFVSYWLINCDIDNLDAIRDMPSVQATRNGMGTQSREGVVIRPLEEVVRQDGQRYIAKHKAAEFSETATPRTVKGYSPEFLNAKQLAREWVTPNRIEHILQHSNYTTIEQTKAFICAMVEDVMREGDFEVRNTKENRGAIGQLAAALYKEYLEDQI